MFITLEGIDCAGKSWAAEYISKKLGNCIYLKHWNAPKKGTPEEIALLRRTYRNILDFYTKKVEQQGGDLVVDRYYPSELVYSAVKRRYEAFDSYWYMELEYEVADLPHALLYVHAPMEEVLKRLSFRGDTYIEPHELMQLEERYQKFLNTTLLNVKRILSGSEDLDEFLKAELL